MAAAHPSPIRAQSQAIWKFNSFSNLAKKTFTFSKFWGLALEES